MRRALNSKVAAAENDYRAILEIFLQDMLGALSSPEWPAAELFVRLLSRALVRSPASHTPPRPVPLTPPPTSPGLPR